MAQFQTSSSQNGQLPVASFSPFPRLPFELRLEIWQLHFFHPQIIFVPEVRPVGRSNHLLRTSKENPRAVQSPDGLTSPLLSLLLTNKETYEFATKTHTQELFARYPYPRPWFYYETDTVYLCSIHQAKFDRSLIQNVAIYERRFLWQLRGKFAGFDDMTAFLVYCFPSVRNLVFVAAAIHGNYPSHVVAKKWEHYLDQVKFRFPTLGEDNSLEIRLKGWKDRYATAGFVIRQARFEYYWRAQTRFRLGETRVLPNIEHQVMVDGELEEEYDRQVRVYLEGREKAQ